MSVVTDAGLISYATIMQASTASSWVERLALPLAQAAGNILLLEWQESKYDDIEDERRGYVQTAKAEHLACCNALIAGIQDASNKVPLAAMYQPVSTGGEQLSSILKNFDALPYTREYVEMMNRDHREMDIIRAIAMNPKYYSMNKVTWCDLQSIIKGELDINEVITVLGDTTQTSLLNGRLGYDKKLAHRNLGLSVMSHKAMGREEVRRERASQNKDVNPLGRHGNMMDMMLSPKEMIAVALQQAQLLQQSEQSANNLCAMADPYKAAELNAQYNCCIEDMKLTLLEGNMTNAYVPNYAQIFNSQIRDFTRGLFSASGGVSEQPAMTPSANPYASPESFNTMVPDYAK